MNDTTDFHLCPSPDGQQIFRCLNSHIPVGNLYHKPRKKRTKLIKTGYSAGTSSSTGGTKPKYGKKPDPAAPKITRPCSECGRTFWSWKALFGHMRCHPERQWRGINPPENLRRPEVSNAEELMTEEDHQVATCLLMLANGPTALEAQQGFSDCETKCRFECSSCKKVFGSHQALGGHRASHKNVKGCFAINRNDGEEDEGGCVNLENIGGRNGEEDIDERLVMALGHQCSICFRVFSSGQALGGHKRCHWEKGDIEPPSLITQGGLGPGLGLSPGCGLDLNLPANIDGGSCTSGLALNLSLGL